MAGDFVVGNEPLNRPIAPEIIAKGLSGLRARLGVYAVLGNHNEWDSGVDAGRRAVSRGVHRVLPCVDVLSEDGAS